MVFRLWFWLMGALFLLPVLSRGQAVTTRVDLLLDHSAVVPGGTVEVAIRLQMAPGWHTYWRTPSGSGITGLPTRVNWTLPDGIVAGEMQWPVPSKVLEDIEPIYGYEGTAVLLVPLTVGPDVAPGEYVLRARVTWLECLRECIRGSTTVEALLVVGSETVPSSAASSFGAWREALPRQAEFPVEWEWVDEGDVKRLLALRFEAPGSWDFLPFPRGDLMFQDVPSSEIPSGKEARIWKRVEREGETWPTTLSGVLIRMDAKGHTTGGWEFQSTVGVTATTAGMGSREDADTDELSEEGVSLVVALSLAFLGGLLLNIMPCVLPVIALKIFGFVRQSGESAARRRMLGGMYGLGVLMSFMVLAGLILLVRGIGGNALWGMQFQNPLFLIVITTLILVVALNLFGVFEIHLGEAADSASKAASKEGPGGAFFGGVLATALATPCSAPFLGVALGYAFVQPAFVLIAVFLAAGAGLAIPYVALAWNPSWLKFLPKPGVWMVRFKVLMGFPMLGTVAWLMGLVSLRYGIDRVFWVGIYLVLISMAIWSYGVFVQRGQRRPIAYLFSVGTLLIAYFWVLEREVEWRRPPERSSQVSGTAFKGKARLMEWTSWSREGIDAARAAGRPVVIDFTAAWCATCQDNKRRVIETSEVADRMKEVNAALFTADLTDESPVLVEELALYKRAAIPLVVVYSKRAGERPRLLPEVLTQARVLDALDWASRD